MFLKNKAKVQIIEFFMAFYNVFIKYFTPYTCLIIKTTHKINATTNVCLELKRTYYNINLLNYTLSQ